MANFLKKLFGGKEKLDVQVTKPTDFSEVGQLKPADEAKSYNVKMYTINVEKFNEDDMKVFETIKTVFNYGDMCLIYEKETKKPVALYQNKINGWERI